MADDPVIAFLTDYGLADPFVGICHAVIARACPRARVIDLTHGVPAHDVRAGALVLARAMSYTPPQAVALAVVDPGVGGPRRAVALRAADGRCLVGPDNGLLWPAAAACGGVAAAVDIGDSPYALAPVSATFHGRDLFAPVAAAIACGTALADVGVEIEVRSLVALEPSVARVDEDGALVAHVLYVDRFGNAQLDAAAAELEAAGLRPGEVAAIAAGTAGAGGAGGAQRAVHRAVYGRTFADVGDGALVLHEDSDRALALAVNRGSAAARLGLRPGDALRIGRP